METKTVFFFVRMEDDRVFVAILKATVFLKRKNCGRYLQNFLYDLTIN